MKCSIKENNFCPGPAYWLSIPSNLIYSHLSDVSLSCRDPIEGVAKIALTESHEITHISLASIAEIFLPQITDSLLEATDHVDVLIDQNKGLFWSTIKLRMVFQ